MQRYWVMAVLTAGGLLAQAPPAPPPSPVVEAPVKPSDPKAEPPAAQVPTPAPGTKPMEVRVVEAPVAEPKPFDQLRPSQRKLAYTLRRAALSLHELGYYRSHPKIHEVREALETLVKAKDVIPEKAQVALPLAEGYLAKIRLNHGLYDAEGKKLLLDGTWKDLQAAARAAAKVGTKGLEPRLAKLKGLLFDPKVDVTAPSWAEPEPVKGKKATAAKGPRVPEGFSEQKAIAALWVRRAKAYLPDTPQEVDVKGEKKVRRRADPVQTKALDELLGWLAKDDLDLLRDPAFGWLDLRRLGVNPGAGLLARAGDIAASKAPEGAPGDLALLPLLEPVLGEAKFSKGEEKRLDLAEVKQGPAPASLADQFSSFEKLGRSREIDIR